MRIFRFPLTKITFFFIIGLALANYWSIPISTLAFAALFIAFLVTILETLTTKAVYKNIVYGISVSFLCVTIGMLTYELHQSENNTNHFINLDGAFDSDHNIELTLREQLKTTEKNFRYIADVSTINENSVRGNIMLNIRRDSVPINYSIGQVIKVSAKINRNSPPLNPDQFDYGAYLSRKEIHGQIFAKANHIITQPPTKTVWYYAFRIRSKIVSNLEKSDLNRRELAVLSALLLGQRQEIDPNIIRDYQFAGAVHILSVSGLHVGLIIMFINAILKFLPPTKSARIFKLCITLAALWMFALIASLSPSVVRAVTMFSFIAIGMSLNRSTNIFHTLIVSLLLILLIQPAFLYDVGFQLSYTALFSILWLQPKISSIWEPKNRLLKYCWDIITVSFAAQIGAFPISLYYFHQFPGLFFITNLVVIPILTLVMVVGIIAMTIAIFSTVPSMVIVVLENLLKAMNFSIHYVATFEKFVISNVPMNGYMLIALYLTIISIVIYTNKPTFRHCSLALLAIILCSVTYFLNNFTARTTEKFIVFHQRNNSIIVNVQNAAVDISASKKLSEWDRKGIQSYATANYFNLGKNLPFSNYHIFKNRKIVIIDSSGVWDANATPNVVMLIQSPKINLERLIATIALTEIVADGSNYTYLTSQWEATCVKVKIPFHNTREKGFYVLPKKVD